MIYDYETFLKRRNIPYNKDSQCEDSREEDSQEGYSVKNHLGKLIDEFYSAETTEKQEEIRGRTRSLLEELERQTKEEELNN